LPILPKKPVMTVEGRGGHMDRSEDKTSATPEVAGKMANAYERIAQQAEKHERLQTLLHYVNKQNLIEEHRLQQKGKAAGIDGIGKEGYGENLEENIDDLLSRMKSFSYRPKAVRRTYIPKGFLRNNR